MTVFQNPKAMRGVCAVTYRATAADGQDAEIRLTLDPAAATLADAWERLSKRYGPIDPRTIEIELRDLLPARGQLPVLVQLYA